MIPGERIRALNALPVRSGGYVLYWMQSSPRTVGNLALEYAIRKANNLKIPVFACFCIDPFYPEANLRHYTFMAEGLVSAGRSLEKMHIPLAIFWGAPGESIPGAAEDASMIVTDRGYLGLHRTWRSDVAEVVECPLVMVEDNAVVPVEAASGKEEWSAGTIRKKIHRQLMRFLEPVRSNSVQYPSPSLDHGGIPFIDAETLVRRVQEQNPGPSPVYRGGEHEALLRLEKFIAGDLSQYPSGQNDPARPITSGLSPYLHFGQISPSYIAQRVLESRQPGADAFLEQLIIRRELSLNFVHFNPHYDRYEGLPGWARKTLSEHAGDPREYVYTEAEFEDARTHDPFWNAAQQELLVTGKMHGYMRMYWGKKILEWTETPEQGYAIALALNNRYELDGRDPNGYAGIAWCFGKHDRAWGERPVFGKVRYMNAAGLERKFRIEKYVERVAVLAEEHGRGVTR
ncbi:MAG: Deoxyribodipyrimidine photo-lyase [Methanoregulaceae archaeon PtaB.Bin152]|nr:MAG: Deoxyribodipyrimidine photo-lyase [Methanoregulaceae archaeon PtaB.Bin152]